MIRFLSTAAFAAMSLLGATSANAGDAAELNVLGFAKDVFAFEQYGVQDGSGFPYAERFYIDIASDKFAPGTPIRVVLQDENAGLDQARAQAAEQGQKIAPDTAFDRGFMAAFNSVTEVSADPHRIVALPRPIFPGMDKRVELKLEEIDVPAPEGCTGLDNKPKGFRLTRSDPQDVSTPAKVLHQDERVPESRGCPYGYRLGGFITNMGGQADVGDFAVLITIISQGFEGPDHHWIAVTGKL